MVENEIQFLSWKEFRQMAPSILQLELRRLDGLRARAAGDWDFHNVLTKARYEVAQFIACVEAADKTTVAEACTPHLHAATLALAAAPDGPDEATAATLAYVIDRLRYVSDRIGLIY